MYPYNLGLLFTDVVEKNKQNIAVGYNDRQYTYQELDFFVKNFSAFLLYKGCKRGDVVAIGNDKQVYSYALMLAALRLGIAYVNIDVKSPEERNLKILGQCKPKIVFCDNLLYEKDLQKLAGKLDCPCLYLSEQLFFEVEAETELFVEQAEQIKAVDGACIAYIMFTSGSTGIPKGVAITQQNLLHFICWGQSNYNISPQDNFANLSPMYFDNSVFDFYISLFSGACLSPISRELLTKPYELVAYLGQRGCTVWFSVPSLLIYLMTMKALNKESLPAVRIIAFGGEGYPKVELKKLYDLFASRARLYNVYGPTECTCICSSYLLEAEDFADLNGLPTLGYLNQNFDFKILDEDNKEADEGELCLIGPNVASGYFNDPLRSAEVFITLTETERYFKRMYKTGDIVKKIDGKLYFLCRKDNQIKHMGYRIELDEIENAIIDIQGVNQVAVIYKRENIGFGKIIAYVASENCTEEQIAGELSKKLPEYMCPTKIIIMQQLPKNPNGKVDRQVLKQ